MRRLIGFAAALLLVQAAFGETVLRIAPEPIAGFIEISSIRGLNEELKGLIGEMVPTGEEPEDPLAGILKGAFGGKYRGLADLERMGFDVDGDLAILFPKADLKNPIVMINVADRAKLEASLAALFVNPKTEIYSGVKYTRFQSGYCSIIRNVFIFTRSLNSLTAFVDMRKNTGPLLEGKGIELLKLDLPPNGADVIGYLNMGEVMKVYGPLIAELPRQIEQSGGPESAREMLRAQGMLFSEMLGQIELLGAEVELEGTDLLIDFSFKFKEGSELAGRLGAEPVPLDLFSQLPPYSMVGAGDIKGMGDYMMRDVLKGRADEALALFSEFQEGVGDLIAFASRITPSPISESVYVYEVVDPAKVARYVESMPELIKKAHQLFNLPSLEIEDVVRLNPSDYKGVAIEGYEISFKRPAPEGEGGQMKARIWYALKGDRLIMGMGTSAEPTPVRDALDAMEGGDSAYMNAGFGELADSALPGSSFLLLISPTSILKAGLETLSSSDPNAAALYGLIKMAPERYGMAVSGAGEGSIWRVRMAMKLEEFKQLAAISAGMRK